MSLTELISRCFRLFLNNSRLSERYYYSDKMYLCLKLRKFRLEKTVAVCVTMNPGYAGRTDLPDNLKVLFKLVSMMIPDYKLIAEIMLFAERFDSVTDIFKKMVKLYKLASEQLSQQDHYDFEMRAVKSVLVMAGSLKQANPVMNEDAVLIRAMQNSNVCSVLITTLS